MNVQEAINKRYSTRRLDSSKKISDTDLDIIIDAARFSPNGFGFESWKFLAIDGNKSDLKDAAMGQQHIEDSSHVLACLSYTTDYINNNKHVITDRLNEMKYSADQIKKYEGFIFNGDLGHYSTQQNHIAAGYAALQAADLGIGSVIVGGFDKDAAAKVLGIDTSMYKIDLLVSLGYPVDDKHNERIHRSKEKTVEKITL